jgi:hypothetical protein
MTWAELDLDGAVWTVPAARIEAGRQHRVRLALAAPEGLGEPGDAVALVFPSPTRFNARLSDMALSAVLRRMGRGDLTVHGFPSTFQDRAGETSGHPREVVEQALAQRL